MNDSLTTMEERLNNKLNDLRKRRDSITDEINQLTKNAHLWNSTKKTEYLIAIIIAPLFILAFLTHGILFIIIIPIGLLMLPWTIKRNRILKQTKNDKKKYDQLKLELTQVETELAYLKKQLGLI